MRIPTLLILSCACVTACGPKLTIVQAPQSLTLCPADTIRMVFDAREHADVRVVYDETANVVRMDVSALKDDKRSAVSRFEFGFGKQSLAFTLREREGMMIAEDTLKPPLVPESLRLLTVESPNREVTVEHGGVKATVRASTLSDAFRGQPLTGFWRITTASPAPRIYRLNITAQCAGAA